MADIVTALATSHGPLLSTPPDYWYLRAQADEANLHWYRGERFDFPALRAQRAPGFAAQATDAVKRERYDRTQQAIAELARRFRAANADIAIVLGNDQREIFDDAFTGAFTVFDGADIPSIPFSERAKAAMPPGVAIAERGHTPPGGTIWPGAPAVAQELVRTLIDAQFDVATAARIAPRDGEPLGIPHAFGFVYRRIMNDTPPPSIPVFTNVGEGLNRPRLGRVLAFGRALCAAIAALPAGLRVAVVASGGMSHFCVDEEFDRAILAAFQAGDESALAAFPEAYFEGNTCEIKSWYVLAACMNALGDRRMELIDYVPCYRTAAGTGSAMGFAAWEAVS